MKNFKELKNYSSLQEHQQKELKKVYNKIIKGEIYARVESVSKSGMSRRIKFFYAEKNIINRCTNEIAWLTGWVSCGKYEQRGKYLTDDGLLVSGCGMDMIFHTLYCAIGYKQAEKWSQRYRTI